MITGKLWYRSDHKDKNASTFESHLSQAAQRFLRDYGLPPNTCLVNESEVEDQPEQVGDITIKGVYNVRPNYLLVGIEEAPARPTPEPGQMEVVQ